MSTNASIKEHIDYLRKLLEQTAEQFEYNFKHPTVIEMSERLDHLILQSMKNKSVH